MSQNTKNPILASEGHVRRVTTWKALLAGSALALILFGLAQADETVLSEYPETKRIEVVDERFGTAIPDPYRWLEADPRQNADVADWVEAQNELSAPYLASLPNRAAFEDRLRALYSVEVATVPLSRSDRYFFQQHSGIDSQTKLLMRESRGGQDRVILDSSDWAEDGVSEFGEWSASPDGRHVAFRVHEVRSNLATIRVLEVDSAAIIEDELDLTPFGEIAWLPDGSGFFYGRNPEPAADTPSEGFLVNHAIYFHRLGTPQSEDRAVFSPESEQPLINTVEVTADGTHAVITSMQLNGEGSVAAIDLRTDDWSMQPSAPRLENGWTLIGMVGTKVYLKSDEGSGRGGIVSVDLAAPASTFEVVVPEHESATLLESAVVGDRLVLSYMNDAKAEVRRFTLDGTPDGHVELPGLGTVRNFQEGSQKDEVFFLFSSFATPTTVYRHDFAAGESAVWSEPEIAGSLDAISVEQHFYASKDGTRIPIFVVKRDDVDAAAPTLLTGSGGFGLPSLPAYSPEAIAWVEKGGIYAVAGIRGGGEYGSDWHDAGRLGEKQNAFDDLVAAAEFLKAEGITTADGLAIHGSVSGALPVAAVANQRPDLFAVAMPDAGILDVLRFDQSSARPDLLLEYGNPAVETDFRNLLSYSPLQNVEPGVDYPAILVTTPAADDLVVPAQSFKYAATLQATDIGERPHLLGVDEVDQRSSDLIERLVERTADRWAFAAKWTGLSVDKAR